MNIFNLASYETMEKKIIAYVKEPGKRGFLRHHLKEWLNIFKWQKKILFLFF